MRRRTSPDVALALGGSGAGITASLVSQAPPAVVPVPLVGQMVTRAKGTPLKVVEQTATEAIATDVGAEGAAARTRGADHYVRDVTG